MSQMTLDELNAKLVEHADTRAPTDRGISNDPMPDLQDLQFRIDTLELSQGNMACNIRALEQRMDLCPAISKVN